MLGDDPTDFDGPARTSAALGAHGPSILFAIIAGIAVGVLVTWLVINSGRKARADQIWTEINKAMRGALQAGPSDAVAGMLFVSRVIELQFGDLVWKGELGDRLAAFRKVVNEAGKGKLEAPEWAYKAEVAVTDRGAIPLPPPKNADTPNAVARAALDEFEKYWSQKEARIAEIRELQACLVGT